MSLKNKKSAELQFSEVLENRQGMRTALRYILILFAVVAITIAIMLLRSQFIVIRNYTVSAHVPGKVRIVALADLHGNMLGKNQERIVNRVRESDPDMIVYLGDMVERTRVEKSIEALVVLTQRLVKIAPVYYVEGNHEEEVRRSAPETYEKLNALLADTGAVLLDNATLQFKADDGSIVNLCGITTHYRWDTEENETVADLQDRDGINVMICHYPESVIWYRALEGGRLDLALCGHTHGGLVRVPLKGGMYAPEWGWWPMYDLGEYPIYSDSDWYNYGGEAGAEYWGTLIISGGLAGEHGVPRVNNPMEISVVDVG